MVQEHHIVLSYNTHLRGRVSSCILLECFDRMDIYNITSNCWDLADLSFIFSDLVGSRAFTFWTVYSRYYISIIQVCLKMLKWNYGNIKIGVL